MSSAPDATSAKPRSKAGTGAATACNMQSGNARISPTGTASSSAGTGLTGSGAGGSARPSTDPVALAAAKAYKAAADAYNKTVSELAVGWDRRIISRPMTGAVKSHYQGMAAAERTFAAAIRKVSFPSGMEGHIKALLEATEATAVLDLKASKIAAGAQVASRDIFIAERVASEVADLVRQDFKVLGATL